MAVHVVSSPFHGFAAHCVPFVPELAQHVVQLGNVILQGRLILQGTACTDGGVVHRVLAAQGFLELLRDNA